ncbi:alanine racemase [Alcanivorax sp. 1008]|uniref:alanine racemase n=1 Tax=Alcanivorax sp. 1008 TaxID=2816853 RepID=UPI001D5B45F0|nr:alanine racemase [Alcanivorax sp. 1008]MCC1495901.1 alanine racemase [Alcanivorax sp. 1008]
MKRRQFLIGAAAVGLGAWWLKPGDRGAPHNDYFAGLQGTLQSLGAGRPLLVIDRQRLRANCERLIDNLPAGKAFRIVAKSLPSLALIREVMALTGSQRLMTFHQPFMNALAAAEPDADLLLGKPMPVAAAAQFYAELEPGNGFDPAAQVQWLIDSLPRLEQYLALAETLQQRFRISIEIDVGLHRGGLRQAEEIDDLLNLIRQHPQHLQLAGLMGYDAHVGKMPGFIESTETSLRKSNTIYQSFVDRIRSQHNDLWSDDLVLNGAGSPTIRLHDESSPLNEVSAGSCLVKGTDFDLPLLQDFQPAAFIATPVLKKLDGLTMPGPLPIGSLWQSWDPNRATTLFIYGGKWMAKPESPAGLSENSLYGSSSNQMMLNGSASQQLNVDDWIFLRPTQSEAVLLQFGDLLALDSQGHAQWWPPLDAGHGR